MSPAKRISKRRLKDDKFVDLVFHYGEVLRTHQRVILGGLAALVVVILGLTWGVRAMHLGRAEAQQEFSAALNQLEGAMRGDDPAVYAEPAQAFQAIQEQHGGKDVGKWSIYYVGYCRERMNKFPEAQERYEEYLQADPKGVLALAAKLGLATCEASLGRYKAQADQLKELAETADVDSSQANAWFYQAGRVYMDSGYFDLAKDVFTRIQDRVDEPTQAEIQRYLGALEQVDPS